MATPSTSNYTLDDDPPNGTRSIHLSNFSIQSTKLPILTIPQSDEYVLSVYRTSEYTLINGESKQSFKRVGFSIARNHLWQ